MIYCVWVLWSCQVTRRRLTAGQEQVWRRWQEKKTPQILGVHRVQDLHGWGKGHLPLCLWSSRANLTPCMNHSPKYWDSFVPARVTSIQMDPEQGPGAWPVAGLSVRLSCHHFSGFLWERSYLSVFNRSSWTLILTPSWPRQELPPLSGVCSGHSPSPRMQMAQCWLLCS